MFIMADLSYCDVLVVLLERFRTEMSMPSYLSTWESIVAYPSYVTSRCDGVIHFIVRFIVPPALALLSRTYGLGPGPSQENPKTAAARPETLVRFRYTL